MFNSRTVQLVVVAVPMLVLLSGVVPVMAETEQGVELTVGRVGGTLTGYVQFYTLWSSEWSSDEAGVSGELRNARLTLRDSGTEELGFKVEVNFASMTLEEAKVLWRPIDWVELHAGRALTWYAAQFPASEGLKVILYPQAAYYSPVTEDGLELQAKNDHFEFWLGVFDLDNTIRESEMVNGGLSWSGKKLDFSLAEHWQKEYHSELFRVRIQAKPLVLLYAYQNYGTLDVSDMSVDGPETERRGVLALVCYPVKSFELVGVGCYHTEEAESVEKSVVVTGLAGVNWNANQYGRIQLNAIASRADGDAFTEPEDDLKIILQFQANL